MITIQEKYTPTKSDDSTVFKASLNSQKRKTTTGKHNRCPI